MSSSDKSKEFLGVKNQFRFQTKQIIINYNTEVGLMNLKSCNENYMLYLRHWQQDLVMLDIIS